MKYEVLLFKFNWFIITILIFPFFHFFFYFILFLFPFNSSIILLTFSNRPLCFTFFSSHVFRIHLRISPGSRLLPLSSFHIHLLSSLPSSLPHSPSRLSPSLFRNSFALPRSSVLSFVFPAASLFVFLALWPLLPFATSSFHWERLVCGGFLYRNGASAAAVRPNGRQGATREATRKDFREPHKGPRRDVAFNLQPRFWGSRACTNLGPITQKEANEMFPWGLSSRLAHLWFVDYIRDIESIHEFIYVYNVGTYVCFD